MQTFTFRRASLCGGVEREGRANRGRQIMFNSTEARNQDATNVRSQEMLSLKKFVVLAGAILLSMHALHFVLPRQSYIAMCQTRHRLIEWHVCISC